MVWLSSNLIVWFFENNNLQLRMMKQIYILFVLISLTLSAPSPQEGTESSDGLEPTEKCDQEEMEELVDRLSECYAESDTVVDEALSIGQDIESVKRAICKAISAKLRCIDKIGPQCFNKERTRKTRFNLLDREFQKAVNNTDLFGMEFIKSCPALSGNEKDLMERITGSSECSYMEFDKKYRKWRDCKNEAVEVKENQLDFLPFVSDKTTFFLRTWCNMRNSYLACNVGYTDCLGDPILSELNTNQDNLFKEIRSGIRESTNTDFTFENDC